MNFGGVMWWCIMGVCVIVLGLGIVWCIGWCSRIENFREGRISFEFIRYIDKEKYLF